MCLASSSTAKRFEEESICMGDDVHCLSAVFYRRFQFEYDSHYGLIA